MNILAINPGHNGSVALLVDGKLEFYIEEERLSRSKYDANPLKGIIQALQYEIDVLVLGGTSSHHQYPSMCWTNDDPFSGLVKKYYPNVQIIQVSDEHHLGHAASAFYNSGFEDAAAVIVDGAGSFKSFNANEKIISGYETETIFDCSYPDNIISVWSSLSDNQCGGIIEDEKLVVNNRVTLTKAYEAVSQWLGFGFIEAGKTMGLAPYGKEDPNIPTLFENHRANKNYFIPHYPAGAYIDNVHNKYLAIEGDPKEWHKDPSKVTDVAKNLAWRIQKDTENELAYLIEKAHKITGKSNIVIAGGYGLNCVANYEMQKRFPKLNLWFDPISHDGGTALGLAKLAWHNITKDTNIDKLENLYLGIKREETYEELFKAFPECIVDADDESIAKLISEKNIVALFQGRSEAGPRALGNRSILYDPTDPNGKDHVNKVKGREWFRPFAGSMLHEHFEEWFETYGLEETQHMMYAMDFKEDKFGKVPAITHVDNTCRIQTVKKEQNSVYYNIINEFYKITNVPIVFNTSFNLAGQPLVETLFEAVYTIRNSNIDYLYLPEVNKMFVFKDNLS